MVVRRGFLGTCLLLGLAISSSAFGAKIQPVYSLKNLGEHQTSTGAIFKKVQVKCNTGPQLRYIHQNTGSQNWCVNGNSSECFLERIEAATRACSVSSSSIASLETLKVAAPPTADELKARAERKLLEEELLANQEKTIEIRTRQLELRKRELELISQRDSN